MKVIINSCLISDKVEDFQVSLISEPKVTITILDSKDAYNFAKELKRFNIPCTVVASRIFEIKCNSISAYKHVW